MKAKAVNFTRSRLFWVSVLVTVLITSLAGIAVAEVKNPHTIIDVMPSEPDSLDPAANFSFEGQVVCRQVYENLIAYVGNSQTEYEGRIASVVPTRENGLVSEDGLTWTFPIRKGVKFHNGDEVTPEDVEYSFERHMVLDPVGGPVGILLNAILGVWSTRDENGDFAVTFKQIDDAVEVDGDNVVFHLKTPVAYFSQILCSTWGSILNKSWMAENGGWPGTEETWKEYNRPDNGKEFLFDKAMGAGPYKFVEWKKGEETTLELFEDYFQGPSEITRAIIKYVPEWTTRLSMIKRGDADFVIASKEFLDELKQIDGVRVVDQLESPWIFALIFNRDVAPASDKYIGSGELDGNGIPRDFFSHIEIRQAFNYAFDFDTYIEEIFGGDAQQPVGPFGWGIPYQNPDQQTYHFDLKKAEALLKEAYDGQLWEVGFKIIAPYRTGSSEYKGMVDVLAYNLKQINPKFRIEPLPLGYSEFYGDFASRIVPLAPEEWLNDYPDPANNCQEWLGSFGYYGQHLSIGGIYDHWCDMGATSVVPEVRQAAYYKVQEIVYEDAPAIWAAQSQLWNVQRSWVQGWYRVPPMFARYANWYWPLWKEEAD